MKKFLVLFFIVSILSSISTQSHAREWVLVGHNKLVQIYMEQDTITQVDTRWGISYKATMKIVTGYDTLIDYYTVSVKHCKAKRGKLDMYMENGVFVESNDFRIGEDKVMTHVADILCDCGKLVFH